MAARSFCISVTALDNLVRPLSAARAEVSSPTAGLVFVSGALTQEVDAIAEQVRAVWRNVPVCVVPGAGVISERGEIEGAPAACGVLWSGGRATPFSVGEAASTGPGALGEVLAGATAGAPRSGGTVLLFARSDFGGDMLERPSAGSPASGLCIFGAGTVGGAALALTATGEPLRGRAAGLVLHGLAPPLVESSAACRLVTPLRTVDETSAGMVLRVGGVPALDLLSSCMPEIRGAAQGNQPQPVVFVALADAGSPEAAGDSTAGAVSGAGRGAAEAVSGASRGAAEAVSSERYVVRPVRGIDPNRRGVMVGPEVKPGMRLAFAVRDAAAARAGLEGAARTVSQHALGAAPRFAIFLSCAGRGQGLYGAPDVEARLLRQRFGDLPIAGMHSAFEIVPWGPGEARLALYTGVLALFRSPS
jgi:small ligand-binding sensory domain FIST